MLNSMPKELKIANQIIPYSIKLSNRARRMRICVGYDVGVVVTMPRGFSPGIADKFVWQKQDWILKSLAYFSAIGGSASGGKGKMFVKSGRREYLKNRLQALDLAKAKIVQWNSHYNFSFGKISIKNQKSRWGSCSKKGNLNFNFKIVHLPESLVDYLVVHELCHLREFNHSKNFWGLVGQAIPDYKKLRKELKGLL